MIQREISSLWAYAPAFADHLWQSTLVALAAALLIPALRKNQARIRYWIWLAASLKFLLPFAPLMAIGKQLSWFHSSPPMQAGLYFTIEQIGEPFASPVSGASALPIRAYVSAPSSIFPAALVLVWLAGFVAVVAIWCVRWRRVSAAIRGSTAMRSGDEVETLRRLERAAGLKTELAILSSSAMMEPGIFGIFRPVLLWPKGISGHLTPDHLQAVLAHELFHVRRRDNLAAGVHMLVEALFWFHPLVWWVGARLVDERERACDEQVLEFGSRREVYAESILKVCEFCVGSPLACVAGVTGSDLKKRMVHIMSDHIGRKLDFSRKLLLTTAIFAAIAVPIIFGVLNATPTRAQETDDGTNATAFQSFSIKPTREATAMPTYAGSGAHMVKMMLGPDGFFAANVTMETLIEEAYGVQANQLLGGPDWLKTDRFDVHGSISDKLQAPEPEPRPEKHASIIHSMLRAGLTESTKLVVHTETKDLPAYALIVAEGGSKLQPAQSPSDAEAGRGMVGVHRMTVQKGSGGQVVGLAAQGISVSDFASQLARQLGVPVVNQTDLKGNYNFQLQWAVERVEKLEAESKMKQPENDVAGNDNSGAAQSISTALEQQLGLKLVPQTQLMPVVVIDHIEKPAEN